MVHLICSYGYEFFLLTISFIHFEFIKILFTDHPVEAKFVFWNKLKINVYISSLFWLGLRFYHIVNSIETERNHLIQCRTVANLKIEIVWYEKEYYFWGSAFLVSSCFWFPLQISLSKSLQHFIPSIFNFACIFSSNPYYVVYLITICTCHSFIHLLLKTRIEFSL